MNDHATTTDIVRNGIAARGIAVALICALMSGCTTSRLASFRAGEPVLMVVSDSVADISISNEHVGSDAKTGAKVGAGTGAVVFGVLAGMTAGALAPLIVPIALLGGAGAGALYGSIGGALVGATRGLPADKFDPLNARLQRYTRSHKLAEEFRSHVTTAAGKRWLLTEDTRAARVQIKLEQLVVGLAPDDRLALTAKAFVTVRHTSDKHKDGAWKWFYYLGPPSDFSAWTDESKQHVEAAVSTAMQHLAAQIVADVTRE